MIGYIWTRESNLYDREKYSMKSQLDACREAAQADGIEIAREFQVQFSGVDLWTIPELTELREIVKQTEGSKRIYCYSQDRLARGEEGPEIFWLLFELRRAGAEVVILKNPVDLGNIAGQIMTLIAGHEAAGEIHKIRDRTLRGKRERVKGGKLWGLGRDKFGYRKDREQGIAEINEPEAETIRRMYRECDAGKGNQAIARDLNRDGIPTSFSGRGECRAQWHPSTIRILLRDPAYKGEAWAYRYRGEALRMPDGLFPAIVDTALWDRVQERLETNRGEKARNEKRPALLRGLIYCRECAARMYIIHQSQFRYYRCSFNFLKRYQNGFEKCPSKLVRADRVEREVWQAFVWLVNHPDRLIESLDMARTVGIVDQLQSRMAVIRGQIDQKGAEQERLARRLRKADGRVANLIEKEIEQIETERANLMAEAFQVETQLSEQQTWKLEADQVYATCAKLAAEVAGDVSFDRQRECLEQWRIGILASGSVWQITSTAYLFSSKLVVNKTYSVLAKSDDKND